ncbi:QacE family quaternary ammonium compound efflux SMR transporter [Paenibacillus selenitireducens]|uniref:QacE family quaternary ammonium compound efflux SMR transporter n=1 Tax=Paenibacillus selenitireducens TaxID=1324314 RepID=A0A1T2X7V4_9BACL|nr:multidrug efflux SMR transporter [Paenibacillus selenitireducens]OPA75766.1 QacE family quaternary ammonium compound efflux SMR transporter [Paenibacillus selenitireducens]
MNKHWIMVFFAAMLEVVWVTGLKHSSTWYEWAGTALIIAICFTVFLRASKALPLGTVYAVFTGLGTAGTVVAEMTLFGEPFSIMKVLLIGLLLAGVIGLKAITKPKEAEA